MDIRDWLVKKYNFTDDDWITTMNHSTLETVLPNSYFLGQGDLSDKIGFVKSGLLRSFFLDADMNEITTHFYKQGSFVFSVDSFSNQLPSNENIIAVDDSELIVISFQKLNELYQLVPKWPLISIDIAESKYIDLVTRVIQFQTHSATERYHLFCQKYPEAIKKVALRHIASYLGIDNATLSRIRSKK